MKCDLGCDALRVGARSEEEKAFGRIYMTGMNIHVDLEWFGCMGGREIPFCMRAMGF